MLKKFYLFKTYIYVCVCVCFIMLKLKYNCIIFPFLFLTVIISMHPSLLSSKPYLCLCLYAKYIQSLFVVTRIYMISGVIIQHWITYQGESSLSKTIPLFSVFLGCLQFCLLVGPYEISPLMLACILVYFFRSYLGHHLVELQ